MDASTFLSALAAIVVIDVVLAGDNAIVIALAARALPPALRRRAIVWGTVGAVGVRTLMTLVVVWLLQVPGLLLAGGLVLAWIAWRLMGQGTGAADAHAPAANGFWGAMRTIVVADAAMGLDNVLAVAGAAHGSIVLVVLGLAISVPIVVWGSQLVLRLVDRFPAVVTVGAAVLLWTAARMVADDPVVRPWLDAGGGRALLPYVAAGLLLLAALVRQRRRPPSRTASPPALPAPAAAAVDEAPAAPPAEPSGVLVPVDGGPNALRAVWQVIIDAQRHAEGGVVHVVNVQPRVSRHIARFVARTDRDRWLADRAQAAIAPAIALLETARVPHAAHWTSGERAASTARLARTLGVARIVIGTARRRSLTRLAEAPTLARLVASAPVPVEIVEGRALPRWERWGLPAGAVGLGGLLLWAAD